MDGVTEEGPADPTEPVSRASEQGVAGPDPAAQPPAIGSGGEPERDVSVQDRSAMDSLDTTGAALALLTLVLAGTGQLFTAREQSLLIGGLAYLGAMLAFAFLARHDAGRRTGFLDCRSEALGTCGGRRAAWRGLAGDVLAGLRGLPATIAAAPLRSTTIAIAFGLAAVIFGLLVRRRDGLVSFWDAFGLWLLALLLFGLAAARPERLRAGLNLRAWLGRHRQALVEAGLLLLLALVLRLANLGHWPDVFGGDEGMVSEIGRDLLASRQGNMFGSAWAHGNLYYYVLGLSLRLPFDPVIAARLPSAIGGALAIPMVYLAGRQLFGRGVGLVAALLIATSHMHIHLSRMAFCHGCDATTAALAMLAMARGLIRREPLWMVLGGIVLGLAQYGYVGGRLVDLVLAAWVASLFLFDPGWLRGRLGLLLTAFGAALITATPAIYWASFRRGDYLARVGSVGLLDGTPLAEQAARLGTSVPGLLAGQLKNAVLELVAYPAVMFYTAEIPMLDGITSMLVLLGLALSIVAWRCRWLRLPALLVWGGLAVFTMATGQGQAYRVGGILAGCALLAALTLVTLGQAGLGGLGLPRRAPALAIGAVVAVIAAYNLNYYFRDFLPSCRFTDERTGSASIVSRYLVAEAGAETILAFTDPDYDLAVFPSVRFLTGRSVVALAALGPEDPRPGQPGAGQRIFALPPETSDLAAASEGVRPVWVVAGPSRAALVDALAAAEPGGERVTLRRCEKVVGELYRLP